MNSVDVTILIVVGFFAVSGLRRGFMLGMIELFAFGLAIVVGARTLDWIAAPLRSRGLPDVLAAAAGFYIAAVAAYAAIGLAIRILAAPLGTFGAGTPLAWVNGVLGLIPGAFRGLALAALIVISLAALPPEFGIQTQVRTSQLAEPLSIAGKDAFRSGLDWAGIDSSTLGLPIGP